MIEFDIKLTEIFDCSLKETPAIILLGHSKTVASHLWFQNLKQFKTNHFSTASFTIVKRHNANYCGTVGYLANAQAAKIIKQQKFLTFL